MAKSVRKSTVTFDGPLRGPFASQQTSVNIPELVFTSVKPFARLRFSAKNLPIRVIRAIRGKKLLFEKWSEWWIRT